MQTLLMAETRMNTGFIYAPYNGLHHQKVAVIGDFFFETRMAEPLLCR